MQPGIRNPHTRFVLVLTFTGEDRLAAETLVSLALAEDLAGHGDPTCEALVDAEARGRINVVAREPGVLSGTPVARLVFARLDDRVQWDSPVPDGGELSAGTICARVEGPLRALLVGERTALNFLGHLSGIATMTRQFVEATRGTNAVVLDTRKTTPGHRRLEKYAVRCGGGTNHRMGLYDGVLVKDNHLAAWTVGRESPGIGAAVRHARDVLGAETPVEVEVDTLAQLEDAITGAPDIVLLDNFALDDLRSAVAIRDERAPDLQLEASGGVTLETIGPIARTGVDRISSGALTHSARSLDLAFDWEDTD